MTNPAYKGKWQAPLVDNPAYKVRSGSGLLRCEGPGQSAVLLYRPLSTAVGK